jgi:trigger factor
VPSTVEKISPTRVKLTVEIPFTEMKPHLDKAYREIASQVSIPGFRKGKVPALVIDQRFGREAVLQEAINSILPKAYSDAIAEAKVVPLGDPQIDVTKLEDNEVVEFSAEVDIRPDFELPDFSTLSVTVDALPDTDKDVDERIEVLRERFATTTDVERAAKDGDSVNIDLTASRDGEVLPNATSQGVSYVIGADGMLDGLDEAVTGLSAGESKLFKSTLVGGEFEGEEAEIEVKVNKVSERELPEVDDEFAALVSEFDTVDEMRADLAKTVAQYAQYEQINTGRNKVLEALVAATELELPERVLNDEVEARKQQITDQLSRAGLSLERYLERIEDDAKTPEEFWKQLEDNTIEGLKAQLILEKIADDEQIGVEQSDLSELLVRKAMEKNSTPQEEAKHMMEHGHLPGWTQEIRRSKALESVVTAAQVVDSNGEPVDLRPSEDAE